MIAEEFRKLLGRGEGETLDFKSESYDLKKSRGEFIKDLLSMANTPRETPSYIVLGVQWSPENGSKVIGLTGQIDDVDFQNALGHDRVQPSLRFTYTPLEIDGAQVGVIEVPICSDGPYTSVKDIDGLQAGAVYYRRGSQNNRAIGTELKRIFAWFSNNNPGVPEVQQQGSWNAFFDAAGRFDPRTTYLLATTRIPSTIDAPINALGMVPWSAVVDFDPDSDTSGFLHCVEGRLRQHRVIHRVVRGENRVHPEPGTHWFFARGLAGRQETLAVEDHRAWLKSYKSELGRQLQRLAGANSPSPVVAILVWTDAKLRNHLRTLIDELYGAFGDSVKVVVVSNDSPSFEGLAEDGEVTFASLTLRSLCAGIGLHFSDLVPGGEERYVLPTSSGAQIEIDPEIWLWLSEDLELLHRSTGLVGDDAPDIYRRGGDVSWRNLHLGHDCGRDKTPALRRQVEEDLQRRQTVRINLYHALGAGGTTVARRIAWDLHNSVPVSTLNRCSPRDTAERIGKVAALTESSVLVVVDSGHHSERDIDDLYEYLKANQTPAVLLQVLRRFTPHSESKRAFWLGAELTRGEADRFRDAYGTAMPSEKEALARLAAKYDQADCNAFFFGLTAYGTDFHGLGPYVKRRIAALSPDQQRILIFLAIGHYYGHQSVPAQAFTSLLYLPSSKSLNFPAVFADDALPALDLVAESSFNAWRTRHPLIALEVIRQALSPEDSLATSVVWRQSLSAWAKHFADFCRGSEPTSSDQLLELARRVFIYRDNVDVLGREGSGQSGSFARLIEDIPSRHGRMEVLRHLTDCFPEEAHFHAHLARLFATNGEFSEALEALDFAISVQRDDHLLHHMRGIILRQRMKSEADQGAPVNTFIETARQASASFEECRQLGPDDEHGYVSELQMLIDLIDNVARVSKTDAQHVMSNSRANPFLHEALDRIEDLLDQAQRLYAGEQPSRYILDCRARVHRLYGDFQGALQNWDNLLSRPEIAKPAVRRQIVWTILRRHDGKWERLKAKEFDRIRTLLEENLDEDINDSTSLRMWLRAIRYTQTRPSLDAVIEKVSYWKANSASLDSMFYLYVLHTLRALGGSGQAAADAERALEECRHVARFRRDRTRSFEWIGPGEGLTTLVHQSQLGDWRDDFWEFKESLARVEGHVVSIDAPHKGTIEIKGGVKAFFVPAKSGLHYGKDENASVSCYVGFSYDGPRAWDVQRA